MTRQEAYERELEFQLAKAEAVVKAIDEYRKAEIAFADQQLQAFQGVGIKDDIASPAWERESLARQAVDKALAAWKEGKA